jgi:hypothetical protein
MEINTINASGFYAGDMQKLVFALEEAFNVPTEPDLLDHKIRSCDDTM